MAEEGPLARHEVRQQAVESLVQICLGYGAAELLLRVVAIESQRLLYGLSLRDFLELVLRIGTTSLYLARRSVIVAALRDLLRGWFGDEVDMMAVQACVMKAGKLFMVILAYSFVFSPVFAIVTRASGRSAAVHGAVQGLCALWFVARAVELWRAYRRCLVHPVT